jgi:hypothetical protein
MTVSNYIDSIESKRKEEFLELRSAIVDNLPAGFEECISYGMIGYVVPHAIYPKGYHCKPDLPLPFICLAIKKDVITLYHMGIYSDPDLMNWFVAEYGKQCTSKLDMGKSCIRMKKINEIPSALIGELITKMSVQDWITRYENQYRKN